MIDLSTYGAVESAIIVRIQIPQYKADANSAYEEKTLLFSDYNRVITVDDEEYTGLGRLLAITASSSQLKSSNDEVSITISGIPNSSIYEIVNSKIKGSTIQIYRVIFDPVTGVQLNITGNPVGRFFGIVNNYSLNEEYDIGQKTATNTIVMICSSAQGILENKVAGRRTNPSDQESFYPGDISMERVPTLSRSKFNFGAPK